MKKYSITILEHDDGDLEWDVSAPEDYTPNVDLHEAMNLTPAAAVFMSIHQRLIEVIGAVKEEMANYEQNIIELGLSEQVESDSDQALEELQALFYFLNDNESDGN